VLKALGLKRKISLGPVATPAFHVLRAGRRLRGTRLDPFGHAEMRRTERALVEEYRSLMASALERLTPATAALVAALATSAEEIRGYEDVKRANIARFAALTTELVSEIGVRWKQDENPATLDGKSRVDDPHRSSGTGWRTNPDVRRRDPSKVMPRAS